MNHCVVSDGLLFCFSLSLSLSLSHSLSLSLSLSLGRLIFLFCRSGIAFSVGATLGPAIGGVLTLAIGISSTFYLVGATFATLALVTNTTLTETLKVKIERKYVCLSFLFKQNVVTRVITTFFFYHLRHSIVYNNVNSTHFNH